ncbi:MAG: virulence RhuM family protein [Muribaculaceae bacterium]|nr:virulence RhuM family protein [Muribaculaceae bacterium]
MCKMDVNNQIIIYRSEDGETRIEVKFMGETVWLSQQQMADLFQSSRSNVVEHIKHIYEEGELDEESTCRNFRQVRQEGNRQVTREIPFYNLDMIISLGYRIRSVIATHFRRWATERLKEYIIKGFTMDDERLKGNGGGAYWRELLDRIRDIRSSEKVMYRQVLDLYATAVDYDPCSEISVEFFKIVQNKLHFAAHGNTAAEVIYKRANADAPMMGLTSFKGDHPTLRDAQVAKNYLSEEELKILNNLVSGYFDFAEIQALRRRPMYMEDYVKQLDLILSSTGEALLSGPGTVSHKQAMDKARNEYRKFQVRELSPVERAYMDTIKAINTKAKKKENDND